MLLNYSEYQKLTFQFLSLYTQLYKEFLKQKNSIFLILFGHLGALSNKKLNVSCNNYGYRIQSVVEVYNILNIETAHKFNRKLHRQKHSDFLSKLCDFLPQRIGSYMFDFKPMYFLFYKNIL